ncbi:hypothetical protein Pst134EA_000846 [Puccinia striiformis f. sp. tritici]|uniref:hypothetical protein n=1 Tax=Puccinia striiformis f. sp. tritici TaxID=168172 RepID=UPI00200734CE|nr:hypothetical protein Pst134EA_000846 [Puccinia striiformis f. sp. tritici]KAH9473778.1 hypothetical protein Pst134EA_000846 [Puccinia striiformis f. sp. tritici]KAI9600164.1 hypothetical protein KEM48_000578 [Puccinia striiformis f. sp. tritici PST-130]
MVEYDVESYLYYPLEHEYTEAAISFQALKAEDFARVRAVQELTSELPIVIFLALLEKQEDGFVEPDYSGTGIDDYERRGSDHYVLDDVSDTSYSVKSLRALDGTAISSNFDFEMDMCVEEDPFSELEVAQEDYQAYHGNWGPTATHWSRRAALVVVPHESLGEYMTSCSSRNRENVNSALCYLSKASSLTSARISMLDAMAKLCEHQSTSYLYPEALNDTLKVALQNSHSELFKLARPRHSGQLPVTFFDWAKKWLYTLSDVDRAEKYQTWIPSLIQKYPCVADRVEIIEKLLTAPGDVALPNSGVTSTPWAQCLTRECVTKLLETTKIPSAAEGSAIVSAIFNLKETWMATSTHLSSIFDRFPQGEAIAFSLGLISQLNILRKAASFPISDTTELCRKLSSRVFDDKRTPSDIITAMQKNCLSHLSNRLTYCAKFSADDIREFWIPFLRKPIPALASRSVLLNTPFYQQLARQLLKHLYEDVIVPCPHEGINPVTLQVECSCTDCKALNLFLQTGSQKVARFKVDNEATHHQIHLMKEFKIPCNNELVQVEYSSRQKLLVTKIYTLEKQIENWKEYQNQHYVNFTDDIQEEHLETLLGSQNAARVRSLAGLGEAAAV